MKYLALLIAGSTVLTLAVLATTGGDGLSLQTQPVTLFAHEHGRGDGETVANHGILVASEPVTLTEDAWITEIEVRMQNAPWVTLHHLSLYVEGEENPDCPAEDRMIASFGGETPHKITIPSPYGVFLSKGSRVYLFGMLHNPLPPLGPGGVYQRAQAHVRLATIPGTHNRTPLQYRHVSLADVHDCVQNRPADTFTVPPHSDTFVRTSRTDLPEPNEEHIIFETDGTIVGMGAHLHPWEGGKEVRVFIEDEQIASYSPEQQGPYAWVTPYTENLARAVRAGEELTIAATYTNESEEEIVGAMGMIGFFFAPSALQ